MKKIWICTVFIFSVILIVASFSTTGGSKINNFLIQKDSSNSPQFKFKPWTLIQGCNFGDLPYHFYVHPDEKNISMINNPGISSYKDFILWAGMGFDHEKYGYSMDTSAPKLKIYVDDEDSNSSFEYFDIEEALTLSERVESDLYEYQDRGLNYVHANAMKGSAYYQTILAGYHFYFDNAKKGLYWAEKAAEQGETGSMKILGDAYINGLGVVCDDIEGLKWYVIASSLGNLAATGQLLSRGPLIDDSAENKERRRLANEKAREWMYSHKKIFISEE